MIADRAVIGSNAVVPGDIQEEEITAAGFQRKNSGRDFASHLISATDPASQKFTIRMQPAVSGKKKQESSEWQRKQNGYFNKAYVYAN